MKKKSITTQVTFNAEIAILHAMMDWVHDQLKFVEPLTTELSKIELALEEALVNIISYAYKKPGGPIELQFYYLPGQEFAFTLKDKGIPFNPLMEEPTVEKFLTLEEREEGGLGIPMIHKLVDEIKYERQEDTNVLVLKKMLS